MGLVKFCKKNQSLQHKDFYIHYKFEGNSKTLDEIKKNSLIDNSLLRHLTIKYKKLDTRNRVF